MPPKHPKHVSSSFDASRFLTQLIFRRYIDSFTQKTPIPERAFAILEGQFPDIDRIIKTRRQQDGQVIIRRRQIAFDKAAIVRYYQIPDIPNDEYNAYCSEHDYDEIIRKLCKSGLSWDENKGRSRHFFKGAMTKQPRLGFILIMRDASQTSSGKMGWLARL
ncbi:hypothetical protein PanWU01x14_056440 [Parasponia andersonii]|uniref:Uncharacterized protein n=1 Tax=Parasponia andersonii TaxID=3476 RepID=A0A2P5DKF2_PARAD|nr:hypothetical protein PanWU01x14_056440 [Parasponia andersonii]